MTSNQKTLIQSLLTALSLALTMKQVDLIWETLESALRQANIQPPTKPTSVQQAKSIANALKRRIG